MSLIGKFQALERIAYFVKQDAVRHLWARLIPDVNYYDLITVGPHVFENVGKLLRD